MLNPQRIVVDDLFTPERKMIFERPREDNDTIVITTTAPGDFHLAASALRVVAETLSAPPLTQTTP